MKKTNLSEQDLKQENKDLLILILVSMDSSLIFLELAICVKIPPLPTTKISLDIPSWDPLMEKQKSILKKLELFTFQGLEL